MEEKFVLQMRDIKKEYYGNPVLKGIDLRVKPGEIHALLGENGAGKSTLMNILFGMPVIHSTGGFQGEVLIDNKACKIKSPKEAMEMGIGMVHQEFMLIPNFTITENIKLNRELLKDNIISRATKSNALKILDKDTMEKDARKALDILGLDIEEYARVAGLPVGHMQFIEIAREIDKEGIKLLVFDEPTAVLAESEADNLIAAMKRLASTGIAILFITHRLNEVIQAVDNVTILRDGELVATRKKEETNVEELAELMVGRKVEITNKGINTEESFKYREDIIELKNFYVNMPGEEVKGIDLKIKKGEIFGIGGLAGQGKIGIANGIMGLYETIGEVIFKGEALTLNSPADSLRSELAFVSEDRRGIGLLLDSSIEHNIAITAIQIKEEFIHKFEIFTLLNKGKIRKHALGMIEELDIRCTGPRQLTRRLSGGNQQKVCLARALTLDPKVLLVSEPTRGIDIGAKNLVLDHLLKINKEKGVTVIITSSELAELRSICDRIAIITEGKVQGILRPDASDKDFGLMMSGQYHRIYREEA